MSLSWTQSASNYTITVNPDGSRTMEKSGTNWTNYCYTATTFSTFEMKDIVATNPNTAIGVTDPAQLQSGDKDESSIRYGFYRKAGPEWRVVVNGSGLSATDTTGTTARMVFDGSTCLFYVDTNLIYTLSSPAVGTGLYGYASVYNDTEDITANIPSTPPPPATDQLLFPPPVAYI